MFNKKLKGLIKFVNHNEGEIYRDDTLIVVGIGFRGNKMNSIYILFNSFIVTTQKYINPYDFKEKIGLCYNRYLHSLYKFGYIWNKVIAPIDDKQ
jgi:hypothetical protein